MIMHKRTWLITGVSSGFGYVMTQQLLEQGDKVILWRTGCLPGQFNVPCYQIRH